MVVVFFFLCCGCRVLVKEEEKPLDRSIDPAGRSLVSSLVKILLALLHRGAGNGQTKQAASSAATLATNISIDLIVNSVPLYQQEQRRGSTMAEPAAWEGFLTWMFSPNWSTIILSVIVAFTLPVLIHAYLYKKAVAKELPSFLLLGSSGAGKTSLLTLVQYNLSLPSLKPRGQRAVGGN